MNNNNLYEDWKKSVIYQIYPKSFRSAHQRATGDIQGIIEKLDYLAFLGVDYLWITPIYTSPQRDNGYDVSNYYTIDESYGTMEDFDQLVAEAKERGIGIMMDIVVNHSSTDHPWFQEARQNRNSRYRDYYIWQNEPNNWQSKFGGSAWKYDNATGQYYLHLFDETQADLNWENEQMRQDVYEMMRFWANKGVSGFRLDVINLISKDTSFPDDTAGDGRKHYTDGPRVHEFIQEMNREVFANRDVITVGEMSSTSIDNCILYSNPVRQELSMTFSFHHLKVDYPNGEKWTQAPFDFAMLKNIMSSWQIGMQQGQGWNALFWCNHDQPRIVSRFGHEGQYHKQSAKMLATALHLLQGTPYIYQGEEIGMTNPGFQSIEDYRDVETLNIYHAKRQAGASEEDVMGAIRQKSRDNSRTPMQWDRTEHAGFSQATPWIGIPANAQDINVEQALQDPDSILHHYKKLIELRKREAVITEGRYTLMFEHHPQVWAYTRTTDDDMLLVINNFYEEPAILDWHLEPLLHHDLMNSDSEVLISNYEDTQLSTDSAYVLRPYESIVFRCVRRT
ncbi:alpha,alpha-phosphotrehalase [Paenibacillus selenitireducens]|uniref:Alpha,alpha-phosphotrehalase n=1 Tax=Paenibacillus selenitireducens TaxID=1324314 RepID=A0A1T2X8H0_9BACL|nr:alpha,alpha-phosphotrehalase [Paenibacillus selenitireducens]OPA76142.1 alpha,alpha-phosphotrehalase [Paenibacillus selenitireducens]